MEMKKSKKGISVKKATKKSVKKSVKKVVKGKKIIRAKKPAVDASLEKLGEVTHYFPHVNAAAVRIMKGSLSVGDQVCIKGHTSDFKEDVASLQLDHASIQQAKKGQVIGLQVKERVRIGDIVYRVKK